ncbi:MAG: FAD-dependent monooxygenase [Proteobacteria bacterium]|nr:FAD-dependent monooxygenase [Pseudomonadota bacterium]
MSSARARSVNIVGAGLAGALLALLFARRGLRVSLYERRADPRQTQPEEGRSINLALAARGTRALERAGIMAAVRPLLIPMRGRMVHEPGGPPVLQPYGQRADEVIWSVGRAALNRVLIEAAVRHPDVAVHFGHTCVGVDVAAGRLQLRDAQAAVREVALAPTIATDGAGSVVRAALGRAGLLQSREDWLDHDYKELAIPAHGGRHVLEPEALHIWPRGGFMLIALPNLDGSFTATLFLPRQGAVSFAALAHPGAAREFFAREFPDVVPFMPELSAQFAAHPQGQLGTVHAVPWQVGGKVLLLGDAAHAIVPFHGQGMNAAFEDCTVLDGLLDEPRDWNGLFAQFEALRRANTEAIARMAVENYLEMRDAVRDAGFVRRKAIAMALERAFPGRFIPRYSMVMFHPEISYADALRRGEIQAGILGELDPGTGADFDPARAAALIEARLPALRAA